jgi:D-inositol-3-phosphate glycosyltransferase
MDSRMTKPTLLIIGDFVKMTGFGRVNEALAAQLADRWDIAVLGVNYKGDVCDQQRAYRLYPAYLGGDLHGVGRLADVLRVETPAACLFVCDPWIGADYARAMTDIADMPTSLLYTPVDATGLRRVDVKPLNAFDTVIAYTRFGAEQLQRSGYSGPLAIIPHGIDLELFHPIDQAAARQQAGLPLDTFAVLVLDQNNPRKRLDIAFDAFARFAKDKPSNVKLVYHGPLGGQGKWDIAGMAEDLHISDRLILPRADGLSIPHDQLSYLYSMCDVKLSTTSGEGWGLTTMEAMACGVPNIVPEFAALGEWARDAVYRIPAVTPLRHVEINTVGYAPLAEDTCRTLEDVYRYPEQRAALRAAGIELVQRPEYRWGHIGNQFDALLRRAITMHNLKEVQAGDTESLRVPLPRELTKAEATL